MEKYRILRLDVMSGNRDNSQVKSAKYFKDGKSVAVENGTLVEIKGLLDGEREIHEVIDVTDEATYVGIISTPEVIYDQRGIGDGDLGNFINEADVPVRVHVLHAGDFLSFTNGEETDLSMGAKLIGKFKGKEVVGRYTYFCYEVEAL